MSTNKTDNNGSHLLAKQAIETNNTAMPFYQYFTVYLIAIFFIVVAGLSSALFFFSQQSTSSQALITDHLVPLQAQFVQQTYLINTYNLIDKILSNENTHEFITMQRKLVLQSKKLSLLNTQQKSIYQQWFIKNNIASKLITRIKLRHTRNTVLKNKALIQIDTLLDAIKIQLNIPYISPDQAELLSKVESNLVSIVIMLKQFSLQTPLASFEQMQNKIKSILVMDYTKKLANLQFDDQAMADIVRDFIRFEDVMLKRGLLIKWQSHLTLMDDYQQQLVAQQQQFHNILDSISGSDEAGKTIISHYIATNKQALSAMKLPLWIFILFALTLSGVTVLLWFIRCRIKSASQSTSRFIDRVLHGEQVPLLTNKKVRFFHLQKDDFFSHESVQLATKIQQLKSNNYSEVEYLALTDENKILTKEIVKNHEKQAELTIELELLELNVSKQYKLQSLLEQQRYKALYLTAIKQLLLLGNSAVTSVNTCNKNGTSTAGNYLYAAHLQGLDLVRKLRQENCYRYLKTIDAILTLTDVNIVSQIQAILLNLRHKLFLCQNRVSVSIDEKILTEVNLDAELFSEMFGLYIKLLLSQQTDRELALNLALVDKNNGQQKICFNGHVRSEKKIVELPQALQFFNDDSTEKSELGDYFITLLQYQHGEDVSVKLTDDGYDFSFTLPLAVVSNQQETSHPLLSLPKYLIEIENVCAKLVAKYLVMPIEVLLAVKVPEQYQRLQQLLHGIGLQVTFVTCERMLNENWQSGRFSVLLTAIDCQPFCSFMTDEGEKISDTFDLDRGVFSLIKLAAISTKSDDYSGWIVGELNAQSAVSELITAMKPWIKEKENNAALSEKVTASNISKEIIHMGAVSAYPPVSFNFERYIKNQGSAELAIFMLDEYTVENTLLVEQLSHAFTSDNATKADTAIQSLLINSKILAADNLLQLCQYWQNSLTTQGLNNSEKIQINLLSKIQQAVKDISRYADAVV